MAAGLALALVAALTLGHFRERDLRTQLRAAEGRSAVTARGLAVCEATTTTLENTLKIIDAGRTKKTATGTLTSDELLARTAAGADACSRALEAEALVREAAR